MKRNTGPMANLSGTTIGFMIGLPAAVICIAIIAISVSSYNTQKLYDKPMTEPVYDQPAYTANVKAPEDVDFENPENEATTAGGTTVIAPEEKPTSGDTVAGSTYSGSQYSGVYMGTNGNGTDNLVQGENGDPLPEDQRIQSSNNLTPAEEAAGESFESTMGAQGTATGIVPRDGNDISDQIWKDDNVTTYNSFTTIEAVADASGKLGTLSIPTIDLTVDVYQSETSEIEAMSRGVAHFNSTSSWDGNVGLCGHNWTESGNGAYFKNVNQLKRGDTITYTTELGTRTYRVSTITTIDQSDWSYLNRTDDNRLTLITCTFNDNSKRLCVQAVAV